jgi:GT2 family glycosyltransferase
MGQKIKIGIVTPVHNRRDLTLLCLRSIGRLESDGLDIFTIIVDDGSTDGTSEAIANEFPDVQVIRADGTLWFTEGTNVGVRAALERNPDYILMINDDQVFDCRSLIFMVETAEAHRRAIVGSILLLWDQPHKIFQTSPIWKTMKGGWQHWSNQTVWTIPDKPWEVQLIVGNCLLVSADAIRQCGLMNSTRYPNFGDAEYTPRLKRGGWKLLIDPRARVFCQPNASLPRIRSLGLTRQFQYLIVDLKHTHNLRRRFYAYWDGAPSRVKGAIAFGLFLGRLLVGRNIENTHRASNQVEPPLKDLFFPEPKETSHV